MTIREQLARQAGWCDTFGSPLYSYLLTRAADSCEGEGPLRPLLAEHSNDPATDALPLRLMGAVHRLVLAGRAPSLAAYYPSVGGNGATTKAWPVFHDVIGEHLETLRPLIDAPVQTNDVGRSAGLLGGFGVIARRTGLPLRLLEVGTSAGLNLRWDRFRFEWAVGSRAGPHDDDAESCWSESQCARPLAWLRMEPHGNRFEVRLRIWPGLHDRVIATTGAHAPSVRWLGP